MDRFREQLAASDNELSLLNIYAEEIHRLSAENERLRGACHAMVDTLVYLDHYEMRLNSTHKRVLEDGLRAVAAREGTGE